MRQAPQWPYWPRGFVALERERQADEYADGLEAARRWAARPPVVVAHDAERELYALASIERDAQRERRRLKEQAAIERRRPRRDPVEAWARRQRGPWGWLSSTP